MVIPKNDPRSVFQLLPSVRRVGSRKHQGELLILNPYRVRKLSADGHPASVTYTLFPVLRGLRLTVLDNFLTYFARLGETPVRRLVSSLTI